MVNKLKVKVIKKGQAAAPKRAVKAAAKAKQNSAREMVSTVTNWVSDFQARKRDETKVAIEKFFSTPRPSES
jgi:hypothetical protein